MKESLESARNIHNLVIISCIVIIIFAISIIPQDNPYRLALRDISFTEDTLISLVKANKIRLGYDSGFVIYPKSYIKAFIEEDSLLKKIEDVNARIRHSNSMNNEIIANDKRTTKLSLETFDTLNARRDAAVKEGIKWQIDYYDSLLSVARDAYLTGIEAVVETDLSTRKEFSYQRRINLPPPSAYDPQKITIGELNSFSQIHADSFLFKTLMSNFRSFVYFYNSNEEKSVVDVKKILDIEASKFDEKPTDDVDISGIKVAARNMYRIAPFIVLGLLIYLITLVIHVESILDWREHLDVAEDFPWMALYKSSFSETISSISMIFPYLMAISIVHASDLDLTTKRIWLGIYFLLFGPTLWYLGKCIEKLRDRIHKKPFVPRIDSSIETINDSSRLDRTAL